MEPRHALTGAQRQRYSRHLLLPAIGESGQQRLCSARIAVVGAGGLGSPALLYLAAAGVGHVSIIDDDDVDLSNLHRQVIHTTGAVGSSKVSSAAAAVRALNPDVDVTEHHVRLDGNNAAGLLEGHHLVLDGADNFTTRYVVNDACAELGIPVVWASIFRTQAQISVFWTHPPEGIDGVDLRDLFPQPPQPGTVPSCGDAGVLGAMCGQVGSMMASEAIKLVCGIGDPLLGRVAFVDILDATVAHIPLAPHQERPEAPLDAAPCDVALVSPAELARELASGTPPVVIDVREPGELGFGSIAHATNLPLQQFLDEVPRHLVDQDVVLLCRMQPRAETAATALAAAGCTRVRVLEGGILAWGRDIDPTVTAY